MNALLRAPHLIGVVMLALLANPAVPAEANELERQLVKREILALYDGAREGASDGTRIHRFAELPLNHLGYILRYRDVRAGLPEPHTASRFAGVLTWFVGPLADGDAYLTWAGQAAREGLRFVVLGDLGATVHPGNLQLANGIMALSGLRHTGEYISPADGSRVTRLDGSLYEFECRLDPVPADYPIIETTGSAVTVGLQLAVPEHEGQKSSTLVAIGERGGFAAFNYEFCHQRAPLHRGNWLIDPFAFFGRAFGQRPFPIPDTTTLSGRRMYFSTVDSDGWSAPLEAERNWQVQQISAEVVARELIEPFPELPVTLDLRDDDVLRPGMDASRSRALVDHILSLPQVTRPGRHAIGSRLARFDASYNSISNLTPLVTASEPHVVLSATGNELAYEVGGPLSTDLFSLRDTLSRTELPRRLKPANINFHMRVGREHAALNILRRHIDAARTSALVPVPGSLYADIVDGFFTAEIAEIGERLWRITKRGEMQTVRFDNAAGSAVDMRASTGVIGYTWHAAALYVALDAAVEAALIRITDAPSAPSGTIDMELSDSRWRLRKLVRESSRLTFEAEGYGPGEFSWRLPAGMACQLAARRDDAELWAGSATADESGRLAFTVPVVATTPLTVVIENCRWQGAE